MSSRRLLICASLLVLTAAACHGRATPTSQPATTTSTTVLAVPAWTERDVIALVDSDTACTAIEDPIRLVDLLSIRSQWFRLDASDFVGLETDRREEPQSAVRVDGLAAASTQLSQFAGLGKQEVWIREDRFAAAQIVANAGGSIYVQVFRVADAESAAKGLVWIDSDGHVHFLGTCAALWTLDFRRFAGDLEWPETHGALLGDLIKGRRFSELIDWSAGDVIDPISTPIIDDPGWDVGRVPCEGGLGTPDMSGFTNLACIVVPQGDGSAIVAWVTADGTAWVTLRVRELGAVSRWFEITEMPWLDEAAIQVIGETLEITGRSSTVVLSTPEWREALLSDFD